MLFLSAALAGDAEPVIFATANLTAHNGQPRAAAEAVVAVQADLVVIVECSRASLARDTAGGGWTAASGRRTGPDVLGIVHPRAGGG
ncbi:MAG: hypothetical protein EXR71_20095 [Myxococcales bacterium]|nr:hypothetical protein [Myxococcales bacterium]